MFNIIVTIQVLPQSIHARFRARGRMTLFYHMSVNQRLIANMVGCLFHSNLSKIWPRTMERKRINNSLLYRKSPNQCCKLSLKSPEGSG